MNKLIILLICTLIGSVRLQAANSQGSSSKVSYQNPCISKTSCRECIQTQNCAWCMQTDFGDAPRCFQPDLKSMSNVCQEEFILYPDNEQVLITNRELTRKRSKSGGMMSVEESASGSASGSYHESSMSSSSGSASGSASSSIVQISPQRVGLKLRTNEKHVMTVRYSQAEDYPVDLYYLMDLSKSMEDDKDKLSKLGDLLSATMKNITSNFRLGFGSFVDKVLMPYVSTVPRKLQSPCDGCEAPYGFKNHMPLNMDTKKFADEVRNAAVSGNLDAPEGGFDAIMQAIVCRDQIGWRDQARHLLVFSTDAGFHYAGDGKLGGVITPNDGECHLDDFGMYTHSKVQDYPSISQINLKVKKNSINVIFAVTKQQISVYNKLSDHIEGSYSAELSEDSSNVVEMVQEQYNKISSSVEMKDNATSAVKIKYFSTCLGNTRTETNKCDGLKVGDVVSFETEIVVTSCPQDPSEWFQTFQIYPVGINESLVIDLEMLCSCPCELDSHITFEESSKQCNEAGTLKCGICECDDTHFGRNCECATNDILDNKNLYMGCRDNTSLIDCNGQGDCSCGQCQCYARPKPEEVISGKYCECDNFSCDRHNGLLCSGPDHGTCICKECVCQPGWTGSACECRESNDTCIAPNSSGDVLCSGHGDCECGACRCHITEEGRYSGHYCERCPTCAGRCQDLKECVQCQVYKNGPLKNEADCSTNCSHIHVIHVTTLEHDEKKDEHLCTFYDEDECRFQFVYTEDKDNKVIIRAQEDRECPPKVFMLGIVLGVIAAIVLIGMAMLLIWKAVTTISDRREFARFEKERMMAKWDTGENPIYKQATSTFKNPTYAGK